MQKCVKALLLCESVTRSGKSGGCGMEFMSRTDINDSEVSLLVFAQPVNEDLKEQLRNVGGRTDGVDCDTSRELVDHMAPK
jgi:hypothetical protein